MTKKEENQLIHTNWDAVNSLLALGKATSLHAGSDKPKQKREIQNFPQTTVCYTTETD